MARTLCTDRVIGAILRSWRYDISGISPEMRKDYEQHFVECARCRSRQKFHRSLDVSLAVLTVLSMLSFLFALTVLQRVDAKAAQLFDPPGATRLDAGDRVSLQGTLHDWQKFRASH